MKNTLATIFTSMALASTYPTHAQENGLKSTVPKISSITPSVEQLLIQERIEMIKAGAIICARLIQNEETGKVWGGSDKYDRRIHDILRGNPSCKLVQSK